MQTELISKITNEKKDKALFWLKILIPEIYAIEKSISTVHK